MSELGFLENLYFAIQGIRPKTLDQEIDEFGIKSFVDADKNVDAVSKPTIAILIFQIRNASEGRIFNRKYAPFAPP